MANAHEQWEADEERFERQNERGEEEREAGREAAREDALHDQPHYNFRTGEYRFPCGLDGETATARVAYDFRRINCPGCIAAREAARVAMAASTARNAAWLAAQPFGDGHRFEVVDGRLVDTYGPEVE